MLRVAISLGGGGARAPGGTAVALDSSSMAPDMATLGYLLEEPVSRVRVLKNDAAPQVRVPAVTNAANHRGRGYNSRRYDNRRRCDYDWAVRATMSIRTTVKAGTTSALSAGTVNTDE